MYTYEETSSRNAFEQALTRLMHDKTVREIEQIVGENRRLLIYIPTVENEEPHTLNFLLDDTEAPMNMLKIASMTTKITTLIDYDRVVIHSKHLFLEENLKNIAKDITSFSVITIKKLRDFLVKNFPEGSSAKLAYVKQEVSTLVASKIQDIKSTSQFLPEDNQYVFLAAINASISELMKEVAQKKDLKDVESVSAVSVFFKRI